MGWAQLGTEVYPPPVLRYPGLNVAQQQVPEDVGAGSRMQELGAPADPLLPSWAEGEWSPETPVN